MGQNLETTGPPGRDAEALELALVESDLSRLAPADRVAYYKRVCESMGLNPLTKPFSYIRLNGKLTLYALKACADQLRQIHGVSIDIVEAKAEGDLFIVCAQATDKTGRRDTEIGAVQIGNLRGEAKANATMKAYTKAKRRVTLSICGLGWLDETETETIPGAVTVDPETAHSGDLQDPPGPTPVEGEVLPPGDPEPVPDPSPEPGPPASEPAPPEGEREETEAQRVERLALEYSERLKALSRRRKYEESWAELQALADELAPFPAVRERLRGEYKSVRASIWKRLQDQRAQGGGGDDS